MKAIVATFNQVVTNLRMELFQALVGQRTGQQWSGARVRCHSTGSQLWQEVNYFWLIKPSPVRCCRAAAAPFAIWICIVFHNWLKTGLGQYPASYKVKCDFIVIRNPLAHDIVCWCVHVAAPSWAIRLPLHVAVNHSFCCCSNTFITSLVIASTTIFNFWQWQWNIAVLCGDRWWGWQTPRPWQYFINVLFFMNSTINQHVTKFKFVPTIRLQLFARFKIQWLYLNLRFIAIDFYFCFEVFWE